MRRTTITAASWRPGASAIGPQGGRGKIILLRYAVGSASTDEREKGFTDTMKKDFPKVTRTSPTTSTPGATSDLAQQKAQNLITKFRGQVDGDVLPQRVERGGDAPGPGGGRDAGEEALSDALLTMRDVVKSFGASRALDGVSLDLAAGGGPRPARREWRGQEHAHEGPERGPPARFGLDDIPRGRCLMLPTGPRDALGPRGGDDLPGADDRPAPERRGERDARPGTDEGRPAPAPSEHRRIVAEALATLGHPDLRPEARAGSLSVGAQQLIEVARALVSDARVIVFDEPTSSLSGRDAERLFEVIGRLRDAGAGDRLHQPFPRRSPPGRLPLHGPPRRPVGRFMGLLARNEPRGRSSAR